MITHIGIREKEIKFLTDVNALEDIISGYYCRDIRGEHILSWGASIAEFGPEIQKYFVESLLTARKTQNNIRMTLTSINKGEYGTGMIVLIFYPDGSIRANSDHLVGGEQFMFKSHIGKYNRFKFVPKTGYYDIVPLTDEGKHIYNREMYSDEVRITPLAMKIHEYLLKNNVVLTQWEIIEEMGLNKDSARGRISELYSAGMIEPVGRRARKTADGETRGSQKSTQWKAI